MTSSSAGEFALDPVILGFMDNPEASEAGRQIAAQLGLSARSFTAVVDANVVLEELLWLAKRPGTTVLDVSVPALAARGVLRAICPLSLDDEVREHLVLLVERTGCTQETAAALWEAYRPHLCFVEVIPSDAPAVRYVEDRDPTMSPTCTSKRRSGSTSSSRGTST